MSFSYRWHVEGRVLLVEGTGDVSLEHFQTLSTLEIPGQVVDQNVHVILYSDNIKSTPPMQQLSKLEVADNRGWVIFVSENDNKVGRFVASVALQLLGIGMRIVPTLEEAQAILKRVDVSLFEVDFPTDPHIYAFLGTIA